MTNNFIHGNFYGAPDAILYEGLLVGIKGKALTHEKILNRISGIILAHREYPPQHDGERIGQDRVLHICVLEKEALPHLKQ